MRWQDWTAIGIYMLGMLAIGWYYSRRTKTTEDYLLGNRTMKPLTVGISLFATLFSAITYLAMPGEMARYGPAVVVGKVASYPVIAMVVGWFLIPYIMRLRITSAYEMLETRLGLSVRMLGCTFFLALRLTWMAVILFATTSIVLVPLTGLDPAYGPLMCAVLALVTIVYTAMGGLRAVVLTDVVQTCILFGGAILTLAFVSYYMGGVGAWWPSSWPGHWPDPEWGFSSGSRSFGGAFLATLVWYICTSGSDQMAIQRYLATKDAPAARKMLVASLTASALATGILSIVGLAVMAYFQKDPSMATARQVIMDAPDQLFPRFVVHGLPAGISGVVVAGVLAAAMSSLASGLNSSCSVITVDFIDRFGRRADTEAGRVRMAKIVSLAVGLVVTVLSLSVSAVPGNLLEVTYKVCNLLTAPLFGLFFMAMFVPWANGRGTLVGAAFGLATVVWVNFGPYINFLWAMPLGLLVQIGVGMLVSAAWRERPTGG